MELSYLIILIIASVISLVILYFIIRGAVKSAIKDASKNFKYSIYLQEETLNEMQLRRARINYQLHLLDLQLKDGDLIRDVYEKKRSMYLDELESVKHL